MHIRGRLRGVSCVERTPRSLPVRIPTPLVLLGLSLAVPPRPAVAQQRYEEKIVVTGSAEPVRLSELGRSLGVVTRSRIAELPLRSLADAVRLVAGAEVRARGDGAVQADFSLRGASFGQALVLVDGVRLNDSQTGHHNGDIPVPLDEVEQIEVLGGPGSSLYGADAFGGVVQVVTRRGGPRAGGSLAGGSSGYGEAGFAGRAAGRRFGAALSLSAQRSGGFLPEGAQPDLRAADRDFRVLAASLRLTHGSDTRLWLSHLDKEFGALGFYGNAPSREWTRQSLLSLDRSFRAGARLAGGWQLFARGHGDHFVYDRRNPALSDNRHESRTLGGALRLRRAVGAWRVSAGGELGVDWVDSSTLGERGFGRASLFGEAEGRLGGVVTRPGLRLDVYGRFGRAVSPSLALSGPLRGAARWRASAGRSFRVPTFTELYYRDPNHLASADLRPESAWAADLGLELDLGARASASLGAFGRREADVIDWVRPSADERWHTENVQSVRTHGIEATLRRQLGRVELQARYTWLETEAPRLQLQSKYVLDFARHAAGLELRARLPGALRLAPTLDYRRKVDGRAWWRLDLRLARAFGPVELFADGRNLLDERYQEIRGVEMPGRGFVAGLRTAVR